MTDVQANVDNMAKAIRNASPEIRMPLFLDMVIGQCRELKRHYYVSYDDYDAISEADILADEERFICDCRATFQAIAAMDRLPEINTDLLAHHLVERASLAAGRTVPLLGDISHLRKLASLYKDSRLPGLFRQAYLSYTRRRLKDGRAIEGAALDVRLLHDNSLEVQSGTGELRGKAVRALSSLHFPNMTTTDARSSYIGEAISALKKTGANGWQLDAVSIIDEEYAEIPGRPFPHSLPVDDYIVHPFADVAGFYEASYMEQTVNHLPDETVGRLAYLLDTDLRNAEAPPRPESSNLTCIFNHLEHEDVYRLLMLAGMQADMAYLAKTVGSLVKIDYPPS